MATTSGNDPVDKEADRPNEDEKEVSELVERIEQMKCSDPAHVILARYSELTQIVNSLLPGIIDYLVQLGYTSARQELYQKITHPQYIALERAKMLLNHVVQGNETDLAMFLVALKRQNKPIANNLCSIIMSKLEKHVCKTHEEKRGWAKDVKRLQHDSRPTAALGPVTTVTHMETTSHPSGSLAVSSKFVVVSGDGTDSYYEKQLSHELAACSLASGSPQSPSDAKLPEEARIDVDEEMIKHCLREHGREMTAAEIARFLQGDSKQGADSKLKKTVNQLLFQMEKQCKVQKASHTAGAKPLWQLPSC